MRLAWQREPLAMSSSAFVPRKTLNINNMHWWPYSASYQLLPAAIGPDRIRQTSASSPGSHIYAQSSTHDRYQFGIKAPFMGGRKVDEVNFANQKVAMADTQQRHEGKDLFFAYPNARLPLLFWDGSVAVKKTGDANKGWDPTSARTVGATQITYEPDGGFESPLVDTANTRFSGYYRWSAAG